MALRLTEPLPGSPTPPPAPKRFADQLVARAQMVLAARDGAGFQILVGETAAIEDRNRRYEARRGLLHVALSVRTEDPAVMIAAYAAVAHAAVTLLEADPREPVFLNLAGVALYELGALGPAERLFRAAKRLNPALPQVGRNLAECARRKRAGVRVVPQAAALLADLAPRAKRVAELAKPQPGLTLSLCMIVKDEEEMLERCLASACDHVDEIVIVDTGSTDRTVEIAESFGATVLHHEWTGDFSEARNVSFDAARGDWLMYLDADEVLVEGDAKRLRELTGHVWREAFFLVEINHTGDVEDGMAVTHEALRIFRNRPEYRFQGRIHEQIAYALPSYLPERLEMTNVRMEHYGYLGAVRDAKGKSQRNIELLERQLAEGIDTPFLDFNLGSEYAAAGDAEKALARFDRAWSTLRDDPDIALYGFASSCGSRLVKALRIQRQYGDAKRRGDEVLEVFPGFTDIVFEQALVAGCEQDNERARELLEQCLAMGDAPAKYSPTVGCGSFIAMASLADVERNLGELDHSEELLRGALRSNPRFLAVVDPLATAMLRRGVPAPEVVREIHGLVATVGPSVRFLLAVALHERGAAVEAEAELRGVLDAQPGAEQARIALAEALLSQDRLAEAAAVADVVDPDARCAGAAARTALFARLADGRRDDLEAVLDRARAAAVDPAELAAFAAWLTVASGSAAPTSIPAAAGPLVLAMLEALLRIHRFEPFGELLDVFEVVALPWRERREQLARLYHRRGFLESAADEWVAVCREGVPDVAALTGLSLVAKARGLDEDAELLASEARALAA
jgi:glycosyltransferase involved in cell wall biosynthesis/thioredoxin-like negative regulator of GroEL